MARYQQRREDLRGGGNCIGDFIGIGLSLPAWQEKSQKVENQR